MGDSFLVRGRVVWLRREVKKKLPHGGRRRLVEGEKFLAVLFGEVPK
jgi:hypothetical protein